LQGILRGIPDLSFDLNFDQSTLVLSMSLPVFRSLIGSCVLLAATLFSNTQAQSIRINEVFADNKTNVFTDGSISDWVELVNTTGQTIELAGYSLTDAAATPRKWTFPSGVAIQPNSYLVVLLDSSRAASTVSGPVLNTGFSIKASGDRLELYAPGVTAVLEDAVRFGPQAANYTIGRNPTASGSFTLTTPTPGSANIQQVVGNQNSLRINEWMASPSSGSDWFEVYNSDSLPVQLTGLHFKDNGNVPSPVAPLSFIGVGLNGFLQVFADNSTNDNEVNFGLSGNGDSVGLFRADGSQIDRIQFGQQVQGISQGRLPDGSDAILSLNIPTPGESNLILYEGLIVNELLSHTDPPFEDAVEFYNTTGNPINIGGWYLSNSRNDLKRYRIPDNTSVPAGGYVVIYENQFNGAAAVTPFSFSSSQGDQVYLSQAVNGNLTGYIVTESFEPAERNISFGRVATSVPGDYKFVALSEPTFGISSPTSVEQFRTGTGASNGAPRVGPIAISEIMYNPLSPDGGLTDNIADEFIELVNIASTNVPLYDPQFPTNQWRLQGGISFSFPANTTMVPGEIILIVSFDPATNATTLNAFRSKYSVPQNVRIFGPYAGKLKNSGDQVELYRPDTPEPPGRPDAGLVPFLRVDKVNFTDLDPWPVAADGTGKSLLRESLTTFGNDPANWIAGSPNPGQANFGAPAGPQLSIQVSRAGDPVQLLFNLSSGSSYTVQYRTDLLPTTQWQTLTSGTSTATTVTVSDPASVSQDQRFYRVVTPSVP
jgi:hypothetical protein